MEPLPEYVSWWGLADELNVPLTDAPSLEYVPEYLIYAAGVMNKAKQLHREAQEAEAQRHRGS